MTTHRFRVTFIAVLIAASGVLAMSASAIASAATAKPSSITRGGTVIVSAGSATSLDPASPLWPTGSSYGFQIYGSLFDPTGTAGSTLAPDLATGYSYSNGYRELTVTLRKGVIFQDGTPFNAAAVQFNIERDASITSNLTQYFTALTSVTTPSKYTVVLHLSQPDTNMAYILADTNAAFIASPTAVNSEGANFGIEPIGAGPFKVTTDEPTVEQILSAWPGYYDARQRYLSTVEYLNTGTNAQVSYDDLADNAIQSYTMIGYAEPPNVISAAAGNPSLSLVRGANLVYLLMPINTNKAPFNNLLAREAIDYCTDRPAIAKYVQGGWATPAYVLGGPSEEYYPVGGVAGAEKLMPYQYNTAKAAQIVQQLGGLSFTLNTTGGETQVIATALQQEWQACGMTVTQNPVASSAIDFANYADGNWQIALQGSGGIFDPAVYVPLYSEPTSADDKYGFNSPTVTNLLNATDYSANTAALTTIWARVWGTEDKLGVNIPVLSGPNLYFNNRCIKGLGFIEAGVIFKSAYYKAGCTP